MKTINSKSLNIPRPVLKRQTNHINEIFDIIDIPRPVLKRQTNQTNELFDIIDIPRPVLKRQTTGIQTHDIPISMLERQSKGIIQSPVEVGLPIFYPSMLNENFLGK